MKIEAGKNYLTRGGQKARVYAVDGPVLFPIHGAIEFNEGWTIASWSPGGLAFGKIFTADIIGEWIDEPIVDWYKMPSLANWVAQDENGDWYWFENRPHEIISCWAANKGHGGYIPTKFNPKFEGSWQKSLVEKPQQ
jgi:hypothetical protein